MSRARFEGIPPYAWPFVRRTVAIVSQIRAQTLVSAALIFSMCLAGSGRGAGPFVQLGPATNLGFSQPLVQVQVSSQDGQELGPTTASKFLLDTGANGIVVASEAVAEMRSRGYQVEGTFREQGIAGFSVFDVSAPTTLQYTDANNTTHELNDVRMMSSTTTSFCQLGFCPFFGIAGMPAMTGRVATLDLTSGSLLDALGLGDGILTSLTDSVPLTSSRRFSIPLTAVHFEPEGDLTPTWADLPFLTVDPVHNGIRQTGNFVLDTGAQLSLISSKLAFELGLDTNGDGRLIDEAVGSVPLGGIGGTVNAPQLRVDELRIPTSEGAELVLTDLQFAVIDIHPKIDGIFGMNLLGAGGGGLLGGILGGGTGTSYFETAHLDFRNMPTSGTGSLIVDLFSSFGDVTIPAGSHGDLNDDGTIDFADRQIWVQDVHNTSFGDANLDGFFNSSDLVAVSTAGEYEDDLLKNSMWSTGDWNGDMEFTTQDLVLAFESGGYSTSVALVPEPIAAAPICLSAILMFGARTLRSSRSHPSRDPR